MKVPKTRANEAGMPVKDEPRDKGGQVRRKSRSSQDEELQSSYVVQNRPEGGVIVASNKGNAADAANFERQEMELRQVTQRRIVSRSGASSVTTTAFPSSSPTPVSSSPDPNAYILHNVESHHTLSGIALQYRVTVEQIKRLNQLWRDEDLHTRKTIKIPTHKHSILYHVVMETGEAELEEGDDVNAKTHTTRNLAKPEEERKKEAFMVSMNADDNPENAVSVISHEDFLRRHDEQVQAVMERQNSLLADSAEQPLIVPIRAESPGWFSLYPTDWRHVLVYCVIIAVVVPIAFSLFERYQSTS